MRALARAVAFFRNTAVARVFRAWAGYAAYSQDVSSKLAAAVGRWTRQNQAACFDAWREGVRRRRRGREVSCW